MSIGDGIGIKAAQVITLPDSVQAMNIYYFKTDFQEEQEEDDITSDIKDWIQALYANVVGNMSDQAALALLSCYWLATIPNEWELFGETTPTQSFTDVTEMLPHGVSALVRAYTTRAKTIGRKYLPAFCEDAQEDGSWVAGAITNLTAYSVDWGDIIEMDANNFLRPAIYSYGQAYVFELTGDFVVSAIPAYQRRRRPGSGS